MSAELLSAAKAEEQRLLKELEATSLFRRLEAVRALLAEYATSVASAPSQPRRPSRSREGSMTTQVIDVAQEYLRHAQRRAQSLEILRVVRDCGIDIKGEKPTTVVASILSHSDLFDNVRGKGYGLREWLTAPVAPDESVEPDDESEQELGHGTTDVPSGDDELDADARSAVHNNGATSEDRSWPRFGS